MPTLIMPIRLLIVAIALLYLAVIPYKVHGFTATVPTSFNQDTKLQWISLSNQIVATQDIIITLYIQGSGGINIMGGNQLIDAIQTAQRQGKRVNMVVTGRAASMHAILLCFADSVQQRGTIMFHAVSKKKGESVYRLAPAPDIEFYMWPCVQKGIMTRDDYNRVLDGQDVNITVSGHRYYMR